MARRPGSRRPLPVRELIATLRQPRYAALSMLMAVVALACVGAGTWQIVRFDGKVHANDALTANAHAADAPVTTVLPLVGGAAPSADAVRYRTVVATGRYDAARQGLVRLADVNDTTGYYVLTPLVTGSAQLLVVRGFVPSRADGGPPTSIAAPPVGVVTVRGRAQTGETRADRPSGLPVGQLSSINPSAQQARIGRRTYNGYVQLLAGQPGTRGLTAIPPPDLSNPAGGAVEPQHFAYIVQWYLFALLALAAPVAMARADRREDDADLAAHVESQPLTDAQRRAAKLADRYGR